MITTLEVLFVYFIQIAIIISLSGIGLSFFKLFHLKIYSFNISTLPLVFFSLGLILITIIGSIINFFFPVNHLVSSFLWLSGVILFYINKKQLLRIYKYSIKPIIILTALIYALALIWGIQIADSFGYHILASKWIAESKMPIGQANLDERLGLNSLIFTTYAITEFLMFKIDKPFFSFFPILFSIFIYASLRGIKRLYDKKRINKFSDYYLSSFLIIPIIYNRSFGSIATDLSAIAFGWLTFYIVALICEKEKMEDERELCWIKLVILFSAFTSTIKLSMAPICLFTIIYIIKQIINKKGIKKLLSPIVFSLLLFSLFIVKGYIQSGYPAFPSSSLGINVDWKVPQIKTDELREFICNFAKDYTHSRDKEYINSYKWVPRWIVQFAIYERGLWITALLSFIVLLMNRSKLKMNFEQKIMLFTAFIGVVFVMYNAPAARFAHLFLFTFIFCPLFALLSKEKGFNIRLSCYPHLNKIIVALSMISVVVCALFIYDTYFGQQIFNSFVLKLFPATQIRSLKFVYGAFSFCLIMLSSILIFISLYLRKKISDFVLSSQKIFVVIMLIGISSHLLLELPAIFGNHIRLRFPEAKRTINSVNNGLISYVYEPYPCNYGLLATTYAHKVVTEIIDGRYYFKAE